MDQGNLKHLVSKYQTIKIVPTVEESLCKMGLNVNLDKDTKIWLAQLTNIWKTWKKSSTIESHIENFFQTTPDPFRLALVFVINCGDYKDCKPKTLPYCIIETLSKWSQTSNVYPEEYLKFPAFNIGIQQRNQHFLNLIVKTYQVSTLRETIVPIVKDMIKNDNCKQASQIVSSMELFDDIPVEQILFPFVLQDKPNMVDCYLSECPSQVKPFLLFLDNLLDKSFNLRDFVQNYIEQNKICQVKYDKIHYKPLGKLVARLCVKFNVPIETCKNLSKNRTTSGLRYLVHQKYQEHKLSSSVWDDLVKDSLRQSAGSAPEFINLLIDYDTAEALKWAEYLNLSKDQLPLALREMSITQTLEEECWDSNIDNTQDYYKLDLATNQIVMIDNAEKFYDLLNSELVNCNSVGLDCEWKPSFGAAQSHVALIQIATNNKVYLIDTMTLNKPEYMSFWYNFNKAFLENGEIIKIGFGLDLDLKEMKTSLVGLGNIRIKGEGLLDLSNLWNALMECGISLPGNSDGGKSLSSLVQACFGLPLQKTEQCSNWELRPLRETQLRYAALDAYVLLQIYNYLQKLCRDKGLNFDEICNDVMLDKKKKATKKVKVIQSLQSSLEQEKSTKDIKLLIEPSLSYLMAYLRYCGIDTVVTPVTMLWHDVINMAISEDRYVVVTKMKHTPTVNYPQNSILDIGKGTIAENLQTIFTKLNICIKQDDLLILCVHCNSKALKSLGVDEVHHLCQEYENSKINSAPNIHNDDENNDDYDNFLSDSDCEEDFYHAAPYPNKPKCLTSTGAVIDIHNISELSISNKTAILCESCGKLFWDRDEQLEPIMDILYKLTKLNKIWYKDKK
ncbi:hypothetical protein K1T71_002601 [Dendrolimus kikuchii]|uniref:Uncharacterized protein n=1 Tax=Dendrolimus kikuchii TaxID=765133 RepID=A0ACC1DD27_9NEOP|nr:hypothetical protein K1T71_002601 [Dendrolimus kikuchii]